jgi:thioredoxin 1
MAQDVNQEDFKKQVEEAKGLVLVDFWAAWCPPCRALSPLLEQIDAELGDKVKVVKVDVDANQQLAVDHGVQGIPTVKLFKDGEEVQTWVGLMPKAKYVEAIDANS